MHLNNLTFFEALKKVENANNISSDNMSYAEITSLTANINMTAELEILRKYNFDLMQWFKDAEKIMNLLTDISEENPTIPNVDLITTTLPQYIDKVDSADKQISSLNPNSPLVPYYIANGKASMVVQEILKFI